MSNIYQRKIRGFVSSNNQETFNVFVEQFLNTTKNFEDIKIVVVNDNIVVPNNSKLIDSKQPLGVFGNIVEVPVLKQFLDEKAEVIINLNDDILLSEGWLEDMIIKIDAGYLIVTGGIADTNNKEFFQTAIEETKDDIGTEDFIYLVCFATDPKVYKIIGLPDSRYSGCCDDMDWIWRILLNKIPYCSLRRIRVAHLNSGGTRGKNLKTKYEQDAALHAWFVKYRVMKQYFQEKHGYISFRETRKFMNKNNYYKKFRCLEN